MDYMGFAFSRAAWSAGVKSSSQRLVLLCLARHADKAGISFPSVDAIVSETILNRKTVFAVLKELRAMGFVAVSKRQQNGNRYQLCIPTVSPENGTSKNGSTEIGSTEIGTTSSTENGTRVVPNLGHEYRSNRELNRTEDSCAPVARAPAAPQKKRPAITHLLEITELPEPWRDYCTQVRPDLDPDRVWTSFRFYWTSGRGSGTRRSDKSWNSTWQTWVRKESESKAPVHQETPEEFGKRIAREMQEEERERQLSLQAMDGRNEYV